MNTPLRTAMLRHPEGDRLPKMIEFVVTRVGELFSALQGSKYWANRERFERRAADDYSDRLSGSDDPREQSIFDDRNSTLRPVATVNAFLEARLSRDFFGSAPWFSVKPQGPLDVALAKQIEPYGRFKLNEAKFAERGRDGIKTTLDLGDCPMMVTYEVRTDESEEPRVVLVNVRTGEAVADRDGNFIVPETPNGPVELEQGVDGTWGPVKPAGAAGEREESSAESNAPLEQSPVGEEPPGFPLPLAAGSRPSGSADAQALAPMALAPPRRMATMFEGGVEFLPGEHEWREMIVPKRTRIYSGLRVEPLEWKGVIFPINCANFEDADMVAVRLNMPLSKLRAMVQGKERGLDEPLPPGELPFSEEIEAHLDALAGIGQSTPEGEHGEPREGEAQLASAMGDPNVNVTMVYGEYDALGDGVMRRFWMLVEEARRMCFWVDYRSALNPWCKKPVFMLAIHQPLNRAYGMGHYELFEALEDMTDEQLNVILRANEFVANPPQFINRKRLVRSQQDPGKGGRGAHPGEVFSPEDNTATPGDIFQVFPWPDKSERAWQLMQLPMQIIQAWSGVTNAAQAAVSALPGNELATGINALHEVSTVMHVHLLQMLKSPFEEILSYALETLFLRQDTDETYEYLEGDAAQAMLLADAEVLRKLRLNVELTLTRGKRQEEKEAAVAAIPMMQQFYTLPAVIQKRVMPMYLQLLAALGFTNPEQFFPTPEELEAQIAAEAALAEAERMAAAQKPVGGKAA